MEENIKYPLFTVIIPQRNRADYLFHTLKTCMIQDYPNFEILVSDDCSSDNSVEVVNKLKNEDCRIKLFRHENNLGMRDNFEFLLNQVNPGYVIALGGDDGLVPGSVQRMHEILSSTKTKLLTWATPKFIFPGLYFESGILTISRRKGVKTIKSKDFLTRMSKNLNYNSDDECPMFYIKGVASTDLIESVKKKSFENRFYSCPTPDGYSGIVLAGEVNHFSFTAEPLSIVGSNHSSQGVSYFRSDKESRKVSEQFFRQHRNVTMHEDLASQPYSPLISLMTADYLLTSRDLPGWKGQFPAIDYKNLLKKAFVELSDGRWSQAKCNEFGIGRELNLLRNIAIKHNLLPFYSKLLRGTKIKKYPLRDIQGSGFGRRSLIFNTSTIEIGNILEASYASKILYKLFVTMSLNRAFKIIWAVFKIALKSRVRNKRIMQFENKRSC